MPRILPCFIVLGALLTSARASEHAPPEHPWADLEIDAVVAITLVSGDLITATIVTNEPDAITVRHALFGEQVIPTRHIATLELAAAAPGTSESSEVLAQHSASTLQPIAPEIDAPVTPTTPPVAAPKPVWDFSLELGGTFHSGNTEDQSGRIVVNASRVTPDNTLRLDAGYRVAARDGDRTENRVTTGAYSEWPRRSTKWSTFAQGRYDVDEFQSWDSRLTASGGLSYHFIDDRNFNEDEQLESALALSMRVGAGVRQEFGSLQEDIVPEGVLGADVSWTISPRQRMNATSTFFPDLDSSGEYRVVSNVDWSIDLDHMDGISLKLGVAHEFESTNDPGIEENDVSAYATLVLDF